MGVSFFKTEITFASGTSLLDSIVLSQWMAFLNTIEDDLWHYSRGANKIAEVNLFFFSIDLSFQSLLDFSNSIVTLIPWCFSLPFKPLGNHMVEVDLKI